MSNEFQPTLVSSMDDIVRILEEQPKWADRMRGIILGKELLSLPAQFYAFAEKTSHDIEELKRGQKTIEDDVSHLKGAEYENRAAARLSALMPRAVGFTRIRVIKSNTVPETENLSEILDSAVESGTATDEEVRDIRWADIIASARNSATGQWGYVICEASTTLREDDIERAVRRAQAIRKATQAPAIPVVIGPAIQPELQELADSANAFVIILRP